MMSEMSLEDLEAEFADELPARDLMATCTPVVILALVDGVFVTSTSLVCVTTPTLPVPLPI